ncbi:hypothetical protein LZ31DRAFT_547413 [Colletotrichum somersetense]|nr:hypothetical protein LZ31DRAFT_547413 [Colletotrichum somersetense]
MYGYVVPEVGTLTGYSHWVLPLTPTPTLTLSLTFSLTHSLPLLRMYLSRRSHAKSDIAPLCQSFSSPPLVSNPLPTLSSPFCPSLILLLLLVPLNPFIPSPPPLSLLPSPPPAKSEPS